MLRELKYIGMIACVALLILLNPRITAQNAITLNSRNDPDPLFTTLDPHYFLYTYEKDRLKGVPSIKEKKEWLCVSITPFGQNANCARPAFGLSCAGTQALFTTPPTVNAGLIEIGDIMGRWGMIGLLYGPTPAGATLPPALVTARQNLFPLVPLGTPITDTLAIDPNQQFGFFSVPIDYRKRGVRFEFSGLLCNDVGINLKVGLCDISQTAQFNNLTCTAVTTTPPTPPVSSTCNTTAVGSGTFDPINPNLTATNVNEFLMLNLQTIAHQINLDIENFRRFSAEDIHLQLFWRHAYAMNMNRKGMPCFEQFLLIPFVEIEGSAPVGHEKCYNAPFQLPFGSGHAGLGFNTGIDLDFTETINFGAEAGLTHYFSRCFSNYPMPTSDCQSAIFPFQTNVKVCPGNNYHFSAWMGAYHFLGCLSFYFQYKLIKHESDGFCLLNPDPAFKPHVLEKKSRWQSQVGNAGFNYDISPYISLGFTWQIPISERAAYRSSTILFSFNAMY